MSPLLSAALFAQTPAAADYSHYLSYGTIGLGLALAVLASGLLYTEQAKQEVRGQMLIAIYVFMGFSLFLVLIGAGLEILKLGSTGKQTDEQKKEAERVATKLREAEDTIAKLEGQRAETKKVLTLQKKRLGDAIDLKEGLMRLLFDAALQSNPMKFNETAQKLKAELDRIHDKLVSVIAELE